MLLYVMEERDKFRNLKAKILIDLIRLFRWFSAPVISMC